MLLTVTEFLKVVNYWMHQYDWRSQEKLLNQHAQFLTNIEGLDIHFVNIKPQTDDASLKTYPIALFHGWPGSFFEMYKLVPLLTKPRALAGFSAVAYEVVIPAIPGFGYSQAAQVKGKSKSTLTETIDF